MPIGLQARSRERWRCVCRPQSRRTKRQLRHGRKFRFLRTCSNNRLSRATMRAVILDKATNDRRRPIQGSHDRLKGLPKMPLAK
jgi:hypothetical protein